MTGPFEILVGDVRAHLDALPERSVQTICTSPPYWGLRNYGVDGQLGSESTPEAFVAVMVDVFRRARRVLRDDGTLFLNLGDCYYSPNNQTKGEHALGVSEGDSGRAAASAAARGRPHPVLKPKDLCGMPWRVALALQADGWYLRADVIWAKGVSFCPSYSGSVMPSSVTDRPTTSHEYLFLLSKEPRYFYDADAVREESAYPNDERHLRSDKYKVEGAPRADGGSRARTGSATAYRNLRSVWTINPQPFPGGHFATFPEKLVEPCVRAGTSEAGCCATCGAPAERIVEKGPPLADQRAACGADAAGGYDGASTKDHAAAGVQDASAVKARVLAGMLAKRTVGWQTGCECAVAPLVPCTVLDPFGGSGTTVQVATRLGRRGVMIELNPAYAEMARQRITDPEYATKLRRAKRAERVATALAAADAIPDRPF